VKTLLYSESSVSDGVNVAISRSLSWIHRENSNGTTASYNENLELLYKNAKYIAIYKYTFY
jgi:hypothetical protein